MLGCVLVLPDMGTDRLVLISGRKPSLLLDEMTSYSRQSVTSSSATLEVPRLRFKYCSLNSASGNRVGKGEAVLVAVAADEREL